MEFVDRRTLSRYNPTPPFARYVHLTVEVRVVSTFGDGSKIIAKFYSVHQ